MDQINPRDLHLGHDEACGADLRAVVESRMLSRSETSWLARAVAGAIRPSRDRPLWDLAHAVAALGLDGPGLIDLALDPTRTTAAALQDSLADTATTDSVGLTLENPRPWRCSWSGLARVLSLTEFMLTADGLEGFADISAQFGGGITPSEAPDIARALASRMASYRNAHMPLAPIERKFQTIRRYLSQVGRNGVPTDDDIVAFWADGAGDDVLFTTVVEHFITYERGAAEISALSAIGDAASLEETENWEDRIEAATMPMVDATALRDALATIAEFSDGPKLLTGAEQDGLSVVLTLDPYHRSRPLTVLRSRAFGAVQSGIANRLRRGSGGGTITDRVACADVDYRALIDGVETLSQHLRRCLTIALSLRTGSGHSTLAEQGERELKRMRRSGFDAPRDQLAASIALVDGALATATEALEVHRQALDKLANSEDLPTKLAGDVATFSAVFAQIYHAPLAQEAAQ